MNNASLATQISQIMHSLATVPGGHMLRVVTKKFPRLEASDMSHYEENEQSFTPADMPLELDVSSHPEEVIITLEGELPGRQDKSQLLQPVYRTLGVPAMRTTWDVRARFVGREPSDSRYELTVFSSISDDTPPWA